MDTNKRLNLSKKDFKEVKVIRESPTVKAILYEEISTKKQFVAKFRLKEKKYSLKEKEEVFIRRIINYSKLKNPAVIPAHGYFLYDRILVREYFQQGSLSNFINGKLRLKPSKKHIILLGIAEGLSYLHSKHILHLNLKPNNILLDENNYPHICDFGEPSLSDSNISNIISNRGTQIYMAPDIYLDDLPTTKCDVFSFSILAYELITERFPYPEMNKIFSLSDFLEEIKDGKRPDLKFISQIEIRELLSKCWSFDPDDRPDFTEIINKMKTKKFINAMNSNKKEIDDYLCLFTEKLPPLNPSTEKTLDKNSIDEMRIIADMLYNGDGVEVDKKEAARYYKMLADEGDVDAMFKYTNMLCQGDGIEINTKEAVDYYNRFADKGSWSARIKYADMLYYGDGIKANKKEAINIFMEASEYNFKARIIYGHLLYNGEALSRDNKKEAFDYFKESEYYERDAELLVAYMLRHGEGVEVNKKYAANTYQNRAKDVYRHDTESMYNYANMVYNNEVDGVDKDEAFKYYKAIFNLK